MRGQDVAIAVISGDQDVAMAIGLEDKTEARRHRNGNIRDSQYLIAQRGSELVQEQESSVRFLRQLNLSRPSHKR